ncbi:cytosolic 5'-nucleotidase 1B isoform X3 [Girardinichthys multiradiatus]|uniref:cytosolic 5'-nucleotidase 1B isoform X3 n=1 Tax=Girardinichthys multiradiatus TaxID=208333 RepID=UPI001FAC0CC6|nr:cytosolic 5'-nucleotidase 1B isoform X3 [Girardinichthys multiradiatus]
MTQRTPCMKKDVGQAVVVAVSFAAVFEAEPGDARSGYRLGVALPLLQVLQKVNERLLEENPAEHQLFDIILITTDSWQQQQSFSIINSTRRHGLEVSRFCFSKEEDFIESLMQNNVQLFLTTDGNEALQATQQGVPSALLDKNLASCPSEQLRVLFCEDAIIQPHAGSTAASKKSAQQSFLAQLGQIRQKFGMFNSPVCFTLVTSRGGKDSCCSTLKSLRALGVSVDEAYCLGGAPRGPFLSLLRPHLLLSDGFTQLDG